MQLKYFFICAMLTIMASWKKAGRYRSGSKKYCLSDTMKKMITLDTVQYCNISKTTNSADR